MSERRPSYNDGRSCTECHDVNPMSLWMENRCPQCGTVNFCTVYVANAQRFWDYLEAHGPDCAFTDGVQRHTVNLFELQGFYARGLK